jgi:hypothetical protein
MRTPRHATAIRSQTTASERKNKGSTETPSVATQIVRLIETDGRSTP